MLQNGKVQNPGRSGVAAPRLSGLHRRKENSYVYQSIYSKKRKTGIGGSDAAAVCGMNPFSSPMKVFRDKTGMETEETGSEAVRQGTDLEEYVARRFAEATGLKVRRSNFMYCSAEHPFMIADIDRLVAREDAGLECKTASAYSADKWKDGNIPLHYVMQCYHYGSDIIGLNQKEPNSKGDAEFSPVLILL